MFTAPLPPGRWTLVLRGALPRADRAHDLTLEIAVHTGTWPNRIDASAATYNSPDHPGDWRVTATTAEHLEAALEVEVRPDPWVAGGKLEGICKLADDGAGRFTGRFNDLPVEAPVEWAFAPERISPPGPAIRRPRLWAEFEEDPTASRLADFSYAGWAGDEAPGPNRPLPVFDVREFGAEPDSGREAHPALQAAIDAAAAAGGGIVTLPSGRFDLSVGSKHPPLEIAAPHVVIRGAGSGPGGTELFCHRRSESPDPKQMWRANEFPCLFHAGHVTAERMGGYGPQPGRCVARIRTAEMRSARLELEPGHGLAGGEILLLRMEEDEAGSLGRWLTQPAHRLARNYLGAGRPLVSSTVRIRAVNGDSVELDAPVRAPIRAEWKPALWEISTLRGIGIESLRLRTAWDQVFDHHRDAEHDNGWDHIRWDGVVDGWIRDVVHDSATTAVALKGCKNCVVMDGRITGNPGHNGYKAVGASSDNLFLRLHGDRAMHAFGAEGTPTGNVFLDCEASEPAGIDLHGGTCLDTLFDRMVGCVQHGGGSDSAVPPRHSRGLVFWNWEAGSFTPYQAWRRYPRIADASETPGFVAAGVRGRTGRPVTFLTPGGELAADASGPWGAVEGLGRAVDPASLYLAQYARRRGAIPRWLLGP